MDGDEPIVVESAARHGVAESDALHAWAFAVDAYEVGEGMVLYVGSDTSGRLLEIGVVQWYGSLAVVHAMLARAKLLR